MKLLKGLFVIMAVMALAVAAMAQGSGGSFDGGTALQATYAPAANSLAQGIENAFAVVMPVIGTLLVVIWGPRLAKDLIKHFTH